MTLDHSAVSTNVIFGNVHTTSLPLTSTSFTPAVLLKPCKLCPQSPPTLCLRPDLICWHPMSFLIPYTSSHRCFFTCLSPVSVPLNRHEAVHVMTGSESNAQHTPGSQTHFWPTLPGWLGMPRRSKGSALPVSPTAGYYWVTTCCQVLQSLEEDVAAKLLECGS